MATKEALDRVKRATVALAFVPEKPPDDPHVAPFVILGSGFCVHPRGVIVTCEHVIHVFLERDIRQIIADVPEEDRKEALWPLRDVKMMQAHALFFVTQASKEDLYIIPAPMEIGAAKTDYDLGVMRVAVHAAFAKGYPSLEIENFDGIYEGMEVATCGFPLGNDLRLKMGTMTSSFTRGILSSIIPAPNIPEELVAAFQLDLTATFGNSGGPVFSWETGRVIGVLQGGPRDDKGTPIPGLVRAESIYRLLRDGLIESVRIATQPPC